MKLVMNIRLVFDLQGGTRGAPLFLEGHLNILYPAASNRDLFFKVLKGGGTRGAQTSAGGNVPPVSPHSYATGPQCRRV